MTEALLEVRDLVVEYAIGGRTVHAVSGVSLDVRRGETLGLVGESGCGKSTLGRAVLQLTRSTRGEVRFDGQDLTAMRGKTLRAMRRRIQLIFQDPIASLNPRRRVGDIIAEPLIVAGMRNRAERDRRVRAVMEAVGLDPDTTIARLPNRNAGQCEHRSSLDFCAQPRHQRPCRVTGSAGRDGPPRKR